MKKLTKREKLLIYILGCFLIGFFGIYFVVLPSIQSFQVVNDQAAEAQFTKESMEMATDAIPSTMEARDAATVTLTSMKAGFPQQLTNEGLDMLLTQLCLDYSLSPKVLAIQSNGMADVLSFVPYTSEDSASAAGETESTTNMTTETSTEDSATTNSTGDTSGTTTTTETTDTETTETSETTETTNSAVDTAGVQTLIGVVNMELTGTQANFYRLLDAVATRPDMIITAFAITPVAQTTATTTTTGSVPKLDGGDIVISVTFEVYMMAQ